MLLNNGHRQGVIKTEAELLADANRLISEQAKTIRLNEEQAKKGVETIEQLKWQNSRRQVTIMALGIHFQLTPEAMKDIVQPFFDKQLDEIKKEVEAIKDEFKANLASGKPLDFTVVENPDLKQEG